MTTIDKVIGTYSDIQQHFKKILTLTKNDYKDLNKNKDSAHPLPSRSSEEIIRELCK